MSCSFRHFGWIPNRRSFQGPLLKYVSKAESDYFIQKVHEGCCEDHLGGISKVRKVLLAGY